MRHLIEHIPFSQDSDRWRFKQILDEQIAKGVLTATAAYCAFKPPKGPTTEQAIRATKKRKAQEQRENGAEDGDGSLSAMIRRNQERRVADDDAFLENLAAKYGPGGKAGAKKNAAKKPDPSLASAKHKAAK
mmetsp:Transcript_9640/g.32678  ORF Transcript_9640/g.32678 Transcript_9640/m.32678 type:complete len:132 (+) Transcript_9640:486-881(+)